MNDYLTQRWHVERDYDFGNGRHGDWLVGPRTPMGVLGLIQCPDEPTAAHVASVHNAQLEPRVTIVRIIPADAVVDTGDHDPEDDGQPTDEEIDEAARYAAGEKFAADISASAYQHLLGLMRRGRRGA